MPSTYAELAELADRFAAALMQRQVSAGERVVIWGQNGAEWVGTFFGCLLRGVICVPLDAAGTIEFARRVVAETTPRLIVGDAELLQQLDSKSISIAFEDFASALPEAAEPAPIDLAVNPDTPLQILFTSGTTAEPKGVVHTHRNVLASLAPIELEIHKYRKYERLVHPLRFLHTLPLSHVFGQFMGLWIPPLLGAEVHFESRLQAKRLIEAAHRERISVLAAVPRILVLMRDFIVADHPLLLHAIEHAEGERIWRRWWRFHRIHRDFGYKFWAFVCGGASLPNDIESFWNTLGFALIQGYGMTETAALITLNHPFKIGRGSIGKVLPGRDVQFGPDGEILVRGDMVSTATWRDGAMVLSDSPWLATGDLAREDDEGHLHFLGRKNQAIVTQSGMNIHPEDVEAALNAQAGVKASAVVPALTAAGTAPVAVLLFSGSQDQAQQAVIAANAQLADFQRIRRWSIWPELDFPCTSTGKIQRRKVTEWVNSQTAEGDGHEPESDALLALIFSITGARPKNIGDDARLQEDLQLDSLGRVQLQSELELKLGFTLDDATLQQAQTIGQLRRMLGFNATTAPRAIAAESMGAPTRSQRDIYPEWTWSWPSQFVRSAFIECILRPLVGLLAAPTVQHQHPISREKPLLLIANHVSTYDVPLILYALPGPMRRHLSAAMAADILSDWRNRRNQGSWFLNKLGPLAWLLVTTLFNVFPLPRSAGFRRSFQYAGEALDRGFSVLVFPEGHRSEEGMLQTFRSGIGLLVKESQTSVLPIALSGLGAMKTGRGRWFRSGHLKISFGSPISFGRETSPDEITAQLQAEVARLLSLL